VFRAVRAGVSAAPASADDDDRPRRPRAEVDDDRPPRRRTVVDDDDDRPRRKRRDEDDEDDDDRPRRRRRDEDDEDDDRPRVRRSRRRQDVASLVNPPAISLMVIGGLGLAYGVLAVVVNLSGLNAGQFKNAAQQTGGVIGAFLCLIWGAVVLMGGLKMKSLTSWGSALTGVIFAMLPCNPCCLLGLPFGIWALVVMQRPEVKEAFR
jgi:hypothetical protein